MRRHWTLLALFLFLPLAAVGEGDASLSGTIVMSSLASDGEVVWKAPFAAAHLQDSSAPEDAVLSGTAKSVHLIAHHARTRLADGDPFTQRSTEHANFTDATLAGLDVRPGFHLFLMSDPDATARLNSSDGTVRPSGRDIVQQYQYTPQREARQVDVGRALAWQGDDTSRFDLRLSGDIYISFYSWDVRVGDRDANRTYTTGPRQAQDSGPLVLPTDNDETMVELYLVDATVELTMTQPQEERIFLGGGDLWVNGTTRMAGADGDIAGPSMHQRADGEPVVIQGETRLSALAFQSSDSFRADLAAEAQALRLAGRDVALPAADPTGAGGLAPVLPYLAFSLLFSVGTIWWLRRRRPALEAVERAMDAGRYEWVVRRAPRFMDDPGLASRASMMHAVSLLGLGRYEDAGDFLQGLSDEKRPDAPTWNYLMAMVRQWQGRSEEAKRLLQECLRGAPQFRDEILANPAFSRMNLGLDGEDGGGYA